jgi:hypothetical protein
MAERERLNFGVAVDRAIAWMVVGLLSWLCYSTMALREQMAVTIARSEARDSVLSALQARLDQHVDEDAKRWKR